MLSLVSADMVFHLIHEVKSAANGSDDPNTKMIKLCCPSIVPFLVNIINPVYLKAGSPKNGSRHL